MEQAVKSAAQQMSQAGEKLSNQQTGKPTQQNQEGALKGLKQATAKLQEEQEQQQQKSQQQSSQGMSQLQPQPPTDLKHNFSKLKGISKEILTTQNAQSGNFRNLDPRTQRTLQESQQEKVTPEYQSLVQRYYKSLSQKRK